MNDLEAARAAAAELSDEVQRLRTKLAISEQMYTSVADDNERLRTEVEDLLDEGGAWEAEFERLRVMLERIAEGPYNGFAECVAIAREALRPASEEITG
jgi:FtsZ-binding cell division protein ZapB